MVDRGVGVAVLRCGADAAPGGWEPVGEGIATIVVVGSPSGSNRRPT